MTALHFASRHGYNDIVQLLLNHSKTDKNARSSEHATPLHLATIHGQLDTIKLLCSHSKVKVNAKTTLNMTALHFASLIDDEMVLKTILDECEDADINSKTIDDITPIHLTSGTGSLKVMEQLLIHPQIGINSKTSKGWTPLHFSIVLRQNQTSLLLLNKDSASINDQTTDSKLTPLHLASLNSMSTVVKRLFKQDAETNILDKNNFTSLHYAAMFSNNYIMKKLINFDEPIDAVNVYNQTALHVAVVYQNLNAVKFLLDQHPPANIKKRAPNDQSVLHLAAISNNVSIVNELVNRTDIDALTADNKSPLYLALQYDSFDVARVLIQHGSRINSTYQHSNTTLLDIANTNNEEVTFLKSLYKLNATSLNPLDVLQLIQQRKQDGLFDSLFNSTTFNSVNLNEQNVELLLTKFGSSWTSKDRKTLLHIAIEKGYEMFVKKLIETDASLVNVSDVDGCYPLHYAAIIGHLKILDLLIGSEVDVNVVCKADSVSSLYIATEKGYEMFVKVLLNNNADVNRQTSHGYTPLHAASETNNLDIIKLLINSKVNTSLLTNNNYTALELAALNNNSEIIRYLFNYTSDPFHHAVVYNHSTILSKYIASNTTIEAYSELFEVALTNDYAEIANILLQQDPSIINKTDNQHRYPLHNAVINGKCNVARTLLENKADVNALSRFYSTLPTDQLTVTALYWAARHNQVDCARMLLGHGAKVDYSVNNGWTPLHEASNDGYYQMAKLLIEHGASKQLEDGKGRRAYDLAKESIYKIKNKEKLLELLTL